MGAWVYVEAMFEPCEALRERVGGLEHIIALLGASVLDSTAMPGPVTAALTVVKDTMEGGAPMLTGAPPGCKELPPTAGVVKGLTSALSVLGAALSVVPDVKPVLTGVVTVAE
jgi:hypothetical protein